MQDLVQGSLRLAIDQPPIANPINLHTSIASPSFDIHECAAKEIESWIINHDMGMGRRRKRFQTLCQSNSLTAVPIGSELNILMNFLNLLFHSKKSIRGDSDTRPFDCSLISSSHRSRALHITETKNRSFIAATQPISDDSQLRDARKVSEFVIRWPSWAFFNHACFMNRNLHSTKTIASV